MENKIVQSSSSENLYFIFLLALIHTTPSSGTLYMAHLRDQRPSHTCTNVHLGQCLSLQSIKFSFILLILSFPSEEIILKQSTTAIIAAVGKKQLKWKN